MGTVRRVAPTLRKGDKVVVTEGVHAGAVGWITALPGLTDGRYRVGLSKSAGKEVWVRAQHLVRAPA